MGLRSVGSSPTFPTISGYNSDALLTNHINIAISRKLLRTTIKSSKRLLSLLKVLFEIGCVHHYIIFKRYYNQKNFNTFVKFTVLFYNNKSFFKSVRLVTTASRKYAISLRALRILNSTLKSSILILSTSKGIVTHKEAIKFKVSGLLLCIL